MYPSGKTLLNQSLIPPGYFVKHNFPYCKQGTSASQDIGSLPVSQTYFPSINPVFALPLPLPLTLNNSPLILPSKMVAVFNSFAKYCAPPSILMISRRIYKDYTLLYEYL